MISTLRLRWLGVGLLLAGGLVGSPAAQAQAPQVGINTTTPTQALDVNGNLRLEALGASGSAQLLQAQPNGLLGLSSPLPATAGLGLNAQLAGPSPVTVAAVGAGASYTQVVAAGRYAFVAGGTQLRAFDLSVPTVPAFTGTTATLQGAVQALASTTTTLYAATTAGLEVYSLGSGSSLALTRATTLGLAPAGSTGSVVYDLALYGRYLYVAGQFAGSGTVVRIYDLSLPTQPALVGTLTPGGAAPTQLVIDATRGRLLLAPQGGAYQVYGLATPATPQPALLTTAPTANVPALSGGLAIAGGILYGATTAGGTPAFAVYDEGSVADPSQPAMLGNLLLPKPVQSFAVAGSYAYLLTADASAYQLYTVLVTSPALVGLDAAGNLASVAPALLPGDNLGNHKATKNLDLSTFQLVGNGGGQGLAISSGGNVGVLTPPTSSYLLDVGGTLRATSVTVAGTLTATGSVVATTNLNTPTIGGSLTGLHSPLAVALGTVGSTGAIVTGSGNYSVSNNSTGSYRITFSGALGTANFSTAALLATLTDGVGFVSCANAGTGYFDVFTSGAGSAPANRAFTFSVFLP